MSIAILKKIPRGAYRGLSVKKKKSINGERKERVINQESAGRTLAGGSA